MLFEIPPVKENLNVGKGRPPHGLLLIRECISCKRKYETGLLSKEVISTTNAT
jgi:hypothetical protein